MPTSLSCLRSWLWPSDNAETVSQGEVSQGIDADGSVFFQMLGFFHGLLSLSKGIMLGFFHGLLRLSKGMEKAITVRFHEICGLNGSTGSQDMARLLKIIPAYRSTVTT